MPIHANVSPQSLEKGSHPVHPTISPSNSAENVEQSNLDVGATIEGVWRPGLYYDLDVLQGLGETNLDLRLAEQALLLLIQRLDELAPVCGAYDAIALGL